MSAGADNDMFEMGHAAAICCGPRAGTGRAALLGGGWNPVKLGVPLPQRGRALRALISLAGDSRRHLKDSRLPIGISRCKVL